MSCHGARNVNKKRLIFAALACLTLATGANADAWRIGVLAHRGHAKTMEAWQPTAEYLQKKLTLERFEIVPLALEEVEPAAARQEIDFLATNTGNYVELEAFHGVSRIATMKTALSGKVFTRFGAVIITRIDRDDIDALSDLKDKRFMGVEENGFGGFRMAWRELKDAGIDPYSDLRELRFSGFPQEQVAFAVRDGVVDVGTMSADALLILAQEGKIDTGELKILNPQNYPDYPTVSSTRLYPSWPFAKLSHTPASIAEQVSAALIQMPAGAPAARAANIAGWTVPLDYQSVHELLIDLRVGPYEHLRHINWSTVAEKYGVWIALVFALTFFLAISSVGLLGANRKLKKVDAELRCHRDRLSELVREATVDLVHARDEALRASEAKSRFLANMSHELRTPLNAIIGYTAIVREMTSEHGLEGPCQDLDCVDAASAHLLALIDDLLDVTLLDTGEIALRRETIDLAQLAKDVAQSAQSAAVQHGNRLECIVERNIGNIYSDPRRIKQILTKILLNGCKFTENGSITLTVSSERCMQRDCVRFNVCDTGPGIAENLRAHLFVPFYKLDVSNAKTTHGLGLGLATAKTLCEKMGGEIAVRSEPGKGTNISVRLPRDMPPEEPENSRKASFEDAVD